MPIKTYANENRKSQTDSLTERQSFEKKWTYKEKKNTKGKHTRTKKEKRNERYCK